MSGLRGHWKDAGSCSERLGSHCRVLSWERHTSFSFNGRGHRGQDGCWEPKEELLRPQARDNGGLEQDGGEGVCPIRFWNILKGELTGRPR